MAKAIECWYIACQDHMTIIGPYLVEDLAIRDAVRHSVAHQTGIGPLPPTGCVFLPYKGFLLVEEVEFEGEAPALPEPGGESIDAIQQRGLDKLRKLREGDKGNG